MFEVTAWNNGGEGYGFKVLEADRDRYFAKSGKSILLYLPQVDTPLEINIDKPSFWKSCRELIHIGIKDWLITNGYVPWPHRSPPRFVLKKISDSKFQLKFPVS